MKAKGGLSYLPNMVTFTSIFLGLLAILWAPTNPYAASIALIFAAICDLLDGMLARMIGVESEFGVEIDSLADFLSSGVAPAILIYYWSLNGYVLTSITSTSEYIRIVCSNMSSHLKTKYGSDTLDITHSCIIYIISLSPIENITQKSIGCKI